MNTWKWTLGEPYYKSARPSKQDKDKEIVDEKDNTFGYDSQQNAINQSLADDTFLNPDADLLSITNSMFSRNQQHGSGTGTRREDLDFKMGDRELISQRGVNPFLQQTSYVNDIVTRDMFLKPINTTQGKVKNTASASELEE
jgi:hypothetical protein